jgi:hypothetical protein
MTDDADMTPEEQWLNGERGYADYIAWQREQWLAVERLFREAAQAGLIEGEEP